MHQRPLLFVSPCLVLIGMIASAQGFADDTVNAQALVEQNCTSCHGSEVYTRSDRRVDSLDALHGQVRMCEQNLGLTWFDDQVDAVTTLLNSEYYQFAP